MRPRAAAADLLPYARDLCAFLAAAPDSSPEVAAAATACVESTAANGDFSLVFRAINDFRHILMRISGQAPADWDLHDFRSARSSPGLASGAAGDKANDSAELRPILPDCAFTSRQRSPFNVAPHADRKPWLREVLLSPDCADPGTLGRRALRWSGRHGPVEARRPRRTPVARPVFALELGGTTLASSPSLDAASSSSDPRNRAFRPPPSSRRGRRVSIPMRGSSLHKFAVAFGIAAQAWVPRFDR